MGRAHTRTCVACRSRRAAPDLLRLVRDTEGIVRVDARAQADGRGAWLCRSVECQARILAKPGPLYRAFRTRALTTDGLTTALIDEANQTLSSLLDRAWRSGQLVLGTAAITKAKSTPPIDVLLFAADAGSKTSTLLKQPHPTADTFSLNLDKCALGAHFRKGPRAAVGVVQGPFSPQICRELRRITALR